MAPVVLPHDPGWAAAFALEAEAILDVIPEGMIELHHIGSTAIPGILAKQIIDLLGVVTELDAVDAHEHALIGLGYEAMGAFGIEGRRYFRKITPAGLRTHHLHVFEAGSPHVARHLAFRDYLIAHPLVAKTYSDLKATLTADPDTRAEDYMDGKDPFIKATEQDALAWAGR